MYAEIQLLSELSDNRLAGEEETEVYHLLHRGCPKVYPLCEIKRIEKAYSGTRVQGTTAKNFQVAWATGELFWLMGPQQPTIAILLGSLLLRPSWFNRVYAIGPGINKLVTLL